MSSKQASLEAKLWAPEIMERRFYCFEQFALPSIRHQEDQGFKICILASPRMPEAYIDRLKHSTADIPQISLHITDGEPGDRVHDMFDRWYAENRVNRPGKTVHFRLDDDDAFSCKLIGEMREVARRLRKGEIFALCNGLLLGRQNKKAVIVPKIKPHIGIGLGFVRDRQDPLASPFRGPPHGKLQRHYSSYVSSLFPAWVYVFHGSNDTVTMNEGRLKKASRDDDRFDIDTHDHDLIAEHYPFTDREHLLELMANCP